jgi:phosphoribosylaminoimidazolecarboxamide formyltransferase/IMP cyclohydrolase
MPTALISVWDKTGVTQLAQRLAGSGFEILSTGGTARGLRDAGVTVREVSDLTGFPEILDGRVKTLHPAVHAGLLARRDLPDHLAMLEQHGLGTIDVLVSNLYPFAEVVARPGVNDDDAIEHIDIGGPAMVRAAAKNHLGVVVLVDPADYDPVLDAIERGGLQAVSAAERRRLAARAFGHVATYDSLVASYLREPDVFPSELALGGRLLHTTRYGENPHQRGAIYQALTPGPERGVATWHVHAGREMSYNNYLDASAAWLCAQDFDDPTVVIVKHTLPCGIGSSDDLVDAYQRALSGDPVSAFGGILACNRALDARVVEAIGKQRFDVMLAPGYAPGVAEQLLKRKNLRVISVGNGNDPGGWDVRSVAGGYLVQERDRAEVRPEDWVCKTQRAPTADELGALAFAWRAVRHVKSNAIVLAQPGVVTGVGAGQPNRVESVRIAVKLAGERARGSVLASDAFFPFPDGIEAAAAAGVSAIAQPGGSVRDDDCIAAADTAGMAMVFTGLRHFRH